jgi:hypothetical protein
MTYFTGEHYDDDIDGDLADRQAEIEERMEHPERYAHSDTCQGCDYPALQAAMNEMSDYIYDESGSVVEAK